MSDNGNNEYLISWMSFNTAGENEFGVITASFNLPLTRNDLSKLNELVRQRSGRSTAVATSFSKFASEQ